MGTRSHTYVHDHNFDRSGEVLMCMYRQMDGYPSGHGLKLARFLDGHKVVNGYSMGDSLKDAFNGAGCCAAAIVAYFKTDIGGIYLRPSTDCDIAGLDYTYDVHITTDEPIRLVVNEVRWRGAPAVGELKYSLRVIFDGPVNEYGAWLAEYEAREAEDEDA